MHYSTLIGTALKYNTPQNSEACWMVCVAGHVCVTAICFRHHFEIQGRVDSTANPGLFENRSQDLIAGGRFHFCFTWCLAWPGVYWINSYNDAVPGVIQTHPQSDEMHTSKIHRNKKASASFSRYAFHPIPITTTTYNNFTQQHNSNVLLLLCKLSWHIFYKYNLVVQS